MKNYEGKYFDKINKITNWREILSRETAGVTGPRLMRHGQPGVEPDGLEDVLAVRGEALHTSHHPVGDVTGQALYEHRSPVGVVLRQLASKHNLLNVTLIKKTGTGKSTKNLMNSSNVGAFLYFSSVTVPRESKM